MPEFPPVFYWLAAALLLPLLPRNWRPALLVATPVVGLFAIIGLSAEATFSLALPTFDLEFLRVDGLSRMFGIAFSIVGIAAGIYAWHGRNLSEQAAMLLYSGGGIGVIFAEDFLTLLLFWEVMAVASTVVIWSGGTRQAARAGYRYLMYHVVGGAVLLAGISVHAVGSGDWSVSAFSSGTGQLGPILILVGVLVNTALPPFHTWLPDAYPKASAAGSVFLSAFTTKTAVYVLARCFDGWEVLFYAGVIMALYGVCYAMISNDIRQILSYHIISQVGYMVAAIGWGGDFAINGASAYAYNHLLYKALMFMGAGAILYTTGETRLTRLGGLGRKMPWVVVFYLIGAAAISGIPFFNGYVSKGMVLGELAENPFGYYLLTFVSVGTFLSVGLKLPYFAWFHREAEVKMTRPVPVTMLWGMAILAFLCVLYGVIPGVQYTHLPFPEDFDAYKLASVAKYVQLQVFIFAAFWILKQKMYGPEKAVIDLDSIYRSVAPGMRLLVVDGIDRVFGLAQRGLDGLTVVGCKIGRNPVRVLLPGRKEPADRDRFTLGTGLALTLLTVVAVFVAVLF